MKGRRLVAATMLLIASAAAAPGQTLCVTAVGSCAATSPAGSQCYCATPNGLVVGIVAGGGNGAFPLFCCTPAGRFGPNPNSKVPVGAPCQAHLPGGSNMTGQACY